MKDYLFNIKYTKIILLYFKLGVLKFILFLLLLTILISVVIGIVEKTKSSFKIISCFFDIIFISFSLETFIDEMSKFK